MKLTLTGAKAALAIAGLAAIWMACVVVLGLLARAFVYLFCLGYGC